MAESLLEQALRLDPEERELLADLLWASVPHPAHESLDQAWADEVERRRQQALRGEGLGPSGREGIAQLRAALRRTP
ncbi:MAG TPA: addiction module protein [Polyangiaceae bacterium]|nr:addiction module protein [Polyangiaceae bacterium]